ncbi:MAG: DUF4347 domain-containing protein, partial [Cyanobacteria bacterium P01_H01_bin.153]
MVADKGKNSTFDSRNEGRLCMSRKVTSSLHMIALEPRIMFDGAAAVTAASIDAGSVGSFDQNFDIGMAAVAPLALDSRTIHSQFARAIAPGLDQFGPEGQRILPGLGSDERDDSISASGAQNVLFPGIFAFEHQAIGPSQFGDSNAAVNEIGDAFVDLSSEWALPTALQVEQAFRGLSSHPFALDAGRWFNAESYYDGFEWLEFPGSGFDPGTGILDPFVDRVSSGNDFIFIDTSVDNYQELAATWEGWGTIVFIDSASDGVDQMLAALAGASDIGAIHIVSHGENGM